MISFFKTKKRKEKSMKLHTKMLGFIAMFFLLTFSLAGCVGSSSSGGVSEETYKFDDGTL
jgi:hypothetical protein